MKSNNIDDMNEKKLGLRAWLSRRFRKKKPPGPKVFAFWLLVAPALCLPVAHISAISKLFGLLLGVCLVACMIIGHRKAMKNEQLFRLRGFALVSIIITAVLAMLAFLWAFDAAPIPNDYTVADLRGASPEYAGSYELLMNLADEGDTEPNGAPAIGLSAQDVTTIKEIYNILKKADYSITVTSETVTARAEGVNQAWQNAKKGREVIGALGRYPEIADLTEPNYEADLDFLENLKRLMQICHLHIRLQSDMGNEEDAIAELLELDSLFRKLSVNARTMITKLVCYAGFAYNIRSANFIINNSHTSHESLESLAENFTRITHEQLSLRNSIISEYLMARRAFRLILEEPDSRIRKHQIKAFLKLNSSIRLHRNFCDQWITMDSGKYEKPKLSVWPTIVPGFVSVSLDSDGEFPWYYRCYNPTGSMLIQTLVPAIEKIIALKTKIRIHEDILQTVLNKRLGKEMSLKARAYSDQYIIDVDKKIIFSPGPDGKAYTKDDIKLAINPQVLNLIE